ncbi:MAG: DUF3187 family protein [Pseudomonadales bacterium]|nr:DUF3187 family protein [Halioglobus sp.]MCP5127946.1 DUF3187 family protein [Pseudomonadales bacterium]
MGDGLKKHYGLLLLPTCLAALAQPLAADEPLYVKNLSPVTGLLGLPSQRAAESEQAGEFSAALHSSVSNVYVLDGNSEEYLNLDGETLRFALDLRYGLVPGLDAQLEIPWLEQSGGDLDRLIDDWHDLWGMSDGGRSAVPRDILDYRYSSASAPGFLLDNDTSGLGDITLALNYAFFSDSNSVASVALGYKFGVGDQDDFLGSGGDDVFLALRFSGAHLSDLPLRWHGQVGYLRAGDSDLLEGIQQKDLWFAGLSLDWILNERWSLIAQLDGNAAPTNSSITAIGDDAGMLTGGVRWRFSPGWSVDFSLVEDIVVETSADVIFQASLRYRGD